VILNLMQDLIGSQYNCFRTPNEFVDRHLEPQTTTKAAAFCAWLGHGYYCPLKTLKTKVYFCRPGLTVETRPYWRNTGKSGQLNKTERNNVTSSVLWNNSLTSRRAPLL